MIRRLLLAAVGISLGLPSAALSNPAATSSTSVQNSNVTGSTVNQQTGGGVNLNQQYNNQWDNHNGFAPGVFCRTPTVYIGGGHTMADNWGLTNTTASLDNTGIQAGVVVPFGSSVLADCKRMAKALTDRAEISNEASLAKTCHELKTLGVEIDVDQFPALKRCLPKTEVAAKPE